MSESEVNHLLSGQKFTAGDGQAAYRVAWLQEVFVQEEKALFLYYTVGADLAPKIDYYTKQRMSLSDPELVPSMYQAGLPVHRRKVVPMNKGPNPEQALADADGENEYPRFMAGQPVCYTRQANGQEWLVYSTGQHMRQALDELWRLNKCVSSVVLTVREYDEHGNDCGPMLYQGRRVYKRLILPSNHPLALRPDQVK